MNYDGLELKMINEECWYWKLEYPFYLDGKMTGEVARMESKIYGTDMEAIVALANNSVKWEFNNVKKEMI